MWGTRLLGYREWVLGEAMVVSVNGIQKKSNNMHPIDEKRDVVNILKGVQSGYLKLLQGAPLLPLINITLLFTQKTGKPSPCSFLTKNKNTYLCCHVGHGNVPN